MSNSSQPVRGNQNDLGMTLKKFAEKSLFFGCFSFRKGQTLSCWADCSLERPHLLRLLLREHDLEQGELLPNVSLKDYRLEVFTWLDQLPQDQILFAMTSFAAGFGHSLRKRSAENLWDYEIS